MLLALGGCKPPGVENPMQILGGCKPPGECLPDEIVQMILSIHADFFGSGLDKRIWKFTPNGDFSWEFLCKLKLPPKIKIFLWLLCHKKLLTNNHRQTRGLASSAPSPSLARPRVVVV
ncbi:unnamed protein product [Prunus armeniaca]